MYEWSKLMGNSFFITDLGAPQAAVINNENVTVERYAVWSPSKNACRHAIVEVGGDLEELKKKYSVPDERICRLVV